MKALESSESARTEIAEAAENFAETAAAEQVSLLPIREKLLAADLEPNTMQELDDMVSKLWSYNRKTTLVTYYLIGTLINKGREKWTYGEKDMEKLAESLETGSSNLYKACQFAEQYSDDQIRQLISGKFVMSWRNIAQNQTIPHGELLKIYSKSETSGEFCNAVTKFKEEANSSKDGSEGSQLDDDSQQGDSENTPGQGENEGTADEENQGNADSGSSEADETEEPEPDSNDPSSEEATEDAGDDNSSTESETDDSHTSSVDSSQIDEVEALKAEIIELEKAIAEKDERVSELVAENAELQARIKELEEQQETSGTNFESIEEPESAEDSPNYL